MSMGLPVALVNGADKFVAKKLVESLRKSDIEVVELGESWGDLSEVGEKVDYVFDFEGDRRVWEKAVKDGSKLAVIGVNQEVQAKDLVELGVNWRVVNLHGVYGVGMEGDEVGFLINALGLAVRNKTLMLPPRESDLRLLAEEDALEAVMRSSFLSGTEGEVLDIWGEKINSEEIAKVLIEEAKMTRFKVEETQNLKLKTQNKEDIETEWRKLRWRPNVSFGAGVKEVLQDFFAKVDEEGRKPKGVNPKSEILNPKLEVVEEDKQNKIRFEVVPVVPDVDVSPKVEVETVSDVKIKTLEEIMAEEYPEMEEKKKLKLKKKKKKIVEKYEDIRPMLVKNSNMRLVQERTEKISDLRSQIPEKKEEPVVVKKVEPVVEIKKVKREIKLNPNWVKWGWRGLAGVWLVVVLVVIGWGYTNYRMVAGAFEIKDLILEKKYVEAAALAEKTLDKVKSEEDLVKDWGLNRFEVGRKYQTVLKALDQGVLLEKKAIDLAKRSEVINEAVFSEKEIDWKEELGGLERDVKETEEVLGLLQARLSGDWGWIPARWKGRFNELRSGMEENKRTLSAGARAVEILPEFLGIDGKRREYMILLQNESEIRPTGGFIGSYAILSFEGGRLLNFDIKDVYEADGQLAGHVEPPEPIKNILGEAKWFMRDANWQPDFVAAAKDIQWFLEKSTGRKVDGVIGMNLAVAKGLVGVVGEVYVPDFKTKINKNNLYEQAEFFSETKFFPGSNQKASFLGGVGKQLFEDIKNLKSEGRLELAKTVIDLLERNEIQMALNNGPIAKVMAEAGWDGTLYGGRCAPATGSEQVGAQCFADYLYLVEANLGVNKANYFIYRNMDLVVDINNQSLSRVLKINYENIAKNSNWPGGDYRNYARIYIPSSSNLAEVSVTDNQSGVKTIYSGDNLQVKTVYGKKEVGFLITVPVGKKVTAEVRYTDQVSLTSKDKFSYLNYIQRQSGSGDTGLVALVSVPEGWQVNQAEPMASLVNGKLLFNQKLEKDIRMGVEIVR